MLEECVIACGLVEGRRCVIEGGFVGGGVSLGEALLEEGCHRVWTLRIQKACTIPLISLSFASYLQIKMWALQFSAIMDVDPLKL